MRKKCWKNGAKTRARKPLSLVLFNGTPPPLLSPPPPLDRPMDAAKKVVCCRGRAKSESVKKAIMGKKRPGQVDDRKRSLFPRMRRRRQSRDILGVYYCRKSSSLYVLSCLIRAYFFSFPLALVSLYSTVYTVTVYGGSMLMYTRQPSSSSSSSLVAHWT